MGRTLSTGSYATQGLYHPNGQLKSFSYGNGVSFSQSLDSQNRPELRKASKGSILLSQQYDYDANNNIESVIDAVKASNSVTNMTYDDLDRLKTATGFWGTGSFDYDALGNISSKVLGTQKINYHYNTKNQLDSVTGSVARTFSYDGRGNVIGNGVRNFGFNRANRIVTSGAISYVYDGHGRRIVKNKSGNKTYSLYNSQGVLMSTFENNGYTDYYYLGDHLVAKEADPQTISDKPGYTGHVEDDDLQLTYMQQRYYDPVIGRFYSNDPVDMLGHMQKGNPTMGFNRYAYSNNNPYKYTDPDGRFAVALIFVPEAVALVKATLFVGSAAAAGYAGSQALNQSNESADPLSGVLEGASEGEKTKGRTTNWDKPGGMEQADKDFDQLVDPDSVVPITDSKGGEGRRGTMSDGSGRGVNVRPNSTDGRPTVEVQEGKDKVKIRYDDEK